MTGNLIFYLELANFGRIVSLHVAERSHDGAINGVARSVTFEAVDPQDDPALLHADPLLSLTKTQAQMLSDELWRIGFRPTQGQQSEGQMDATRRHLGDMRAMVAALSKVELPK